MSTKRFLRFGVLSVMMLVLAASAPISAPTADSSETTSETAPVDVAAETRQVTHVLGESNVPVDPQRIVALGEDWMLANLVNLGVTPVASTVNVVDAVKGVDPAVLSDMTLWTSQQISPEALVAIEPDLIIGLEYWVNEIGYDLLSQIAPVIVIPQLGIKEQYRVTAETLGLGDKAAADLAAYEQQVTEASASLGDDKPSVSVATIYSGGSLAAWVDGPDAAVPTVLVDLGIALNPDGTEAETSGATNGRAWLSMEQLPLFDGDILILLQSSAVEGEDESIAQVESDALWALLPAVQTGNVHVIDRLGAPGFAGLVSTFDEVVEILNDVE